MSDILTTADPRTKTGEWTQEQQKESKHALQKFEGRK